MADGNVVGYTPPDNWFGETTFTYQVSDGTLTSSVATITIAVEADNDPPVANAVNAALNEDTPTAITLSGSDTEGATLIYRIIATPRHGTLSAIDPQTHQVTYTPANHWFGEDRFTYVVNDGALDSETATVSLSVASALDSPNDPPVACDALMATSNGNPVSVTLLGIETDPGQTLTYAVVTQPAHGALTGTAPDLTYTPTPYWFGTDEFTFTVSDGTNTSTPGYVSISVAALQVNGNNAPYAYPGAVTVAEDSAVVITLGGMDTDDDELSFLIVSGPAHGTLQGVGAGNEVQHTLIYAPTADYFGSDSFTFTVNDGMTDSTAATIAITVTPVNDPPVALDVYSGTYPQTTVSILLVGDDADTDPAHDPDVLQYYIHTLPAHGTLALNGVPLSGPTHLYSARTVTYTPAAEWGSEDTFTYQVSDGQQWSSQGQVRVVTDKIAGWSETVPYLLVKTYTDPSLAPQYLRASEVGGTIYFGVYLGMHGADHVVNTALALTISESDGPCTGSWTVPVMIDFTNTSVWAYSDDGITWGAAAQSPSEGAGSGTGYGYYRYNPDPPITWDTAAAGQPTGHNGAFSIQGMEQVIFNCPCIEPENPSEIPTTVAGTATVKNLIITNVSTSNGNAQNDYIKFDPDGDAELARPVFNFTIENAAPTSGNYTCVIKLWSTSSGQQAIISKEITSVHPVVPVSIAWDGATTIGGTGIAERGLYTFDIIVSEAGSTSQTFSLKEPYELLKVADDHQVWTEDVVGEGEVYQCTELRCYYSLEGEVDATELHLTPVDWDLNEHAAVEQGGVVPGIVYNGSNDNGICAYRTSGDQMFGWRVVFTGEAGYGETIRRDHTRPRILAVNGKNKDPRLVPLTGNYHNSPWSAIWVRTTAGKVEVKTFDDNPRKSVKSVANGLSATNISFALINGGFFDPPTGETLCREGEWYGNWPGNDTIRHRWCYGIRPYKMPPNPAINGAHWKNALKMRIERLLPGPSNNYIMHPSIRQAYPCGLSNVGALIVNGVKKGTNEQGSGPEDPFASKNARSIVAHASNGDIFLISSRDQGIPSSHKWYWSDAQQFLSTELPDRIHNGYNQTIQIDNAVMHDGGGSTELSYFIKNNPTATHLETGENNRAVRSKLIVLAP